MEDIVYIAYGLIAFTLAISGLAMAIGVRACMMAHGNSMDIERMSEDLWLVEEALKYKKDQQG
ncbi:hypothetical protein [Peptoclostridium litorale]|uniref:hypothetical protein n=1 Tax=Peptoclostridium litorale TaxID=1557 RepID=UPI00056DA38B|nr:hypothetical protein [Peptoclostridium litorale]